MKPVQMTELKKGDLFALVIQGRGRESFTVVKVGLNEVTCVTTVDADLVHNKKPKEIKKRIKGYCYLLKRKGL